MEYMIEMIESITNIMSRKESFEKNNSVDRLAINYKNAQRFITTWKNEKSIPEHIKEYIKLCIEYCNWIDSLRLTASR
jgi:hypothetical protein